MKETQINIRINEKLLEKFTKACKSRKDTKTEIVTKAIEDYINGKHEKQRIMKKDYPVILMTKPTPDGDDGKYIHLPGPSLIGSQTLCGWTDCQGSEEHFASEVGDANCSGCLDVVRESRKYTRTMIKT